MSFVTTELADAINEVEIETSPVERITQLKNMLRDKTGTWWPYKGESIEDLERRLQALEVEEAKKAKEVEEVEEVKEVEEVEKDEEDEEDEEDGEDEDDLAPEMHETEEKTPTK